jgi:hypothetical protein
LNFEQYPADYLNIKLNDIMTIGKVKQRNINLLDCHAESRLRRESMNCNETSLDSARDDTNYIFLIIFPDTQ